MAVGDAHLMNADGNALCGSSGPLRGYNATSQRCRECDSSNDRPGSSEWTVAGFVFPVDRTMPRFGGFGTANALLRKRPTRLSRLP